MTPENINGKCDGCGKYPRVLTRIDSGQSICHTCLREIRPPRPKDLATLENIAYLRNEGLSVSDDLTKTECKRLKKLITVRRHGYTVPVDTPMEELKRLIDQDHEVMTTRNVNQQDEWEYLKRNYRVAAPGSKVRHFFTEVAGLTFRNTDGSERQSIVQDCSLFEKLCFEREEDNPYDPNAIKVSRAGGAQLGFLSMEFAYHAAPEADAGFGFTGFVVGFTDGTAEWPKSGVAIMVLIAAPEATDVEVQEYLDSITDEMRERAKQYQSGKAQE